MGAGMWRTPSWMLLCLIVSPVHASAYQRSTTSADSGVCLYWEDPEIVWRAADPLGVDIDRESAFLDAIRRAHLRWTAPPCTSLRLTEGSRADRTIGYVRSGENSNVLLFRTKGTCDAYAGDPCYREGTCVETYDCWDYPADLLSVTTTTFDRCGRLLDADTELNGGTFRFTASDGPPCKTDMGDPDCIAFDVESVAAFDVGRMIGLDPVYGAGAAPDATMFAAYSEGDTAKRDLAPDDIEGLCAIYPRDQPPVGCVPASDCDAAGGSGGGGSGGAGGIGGAGGEAGAGGSVSGRGGERTPIIVNVHPQSGCGCAAINPGEAAALGLPVMLIARRRRRRGPQVAHRCGTR